MQYGVPSNPQVSGKQMMRKEVSLYQSIFQLHSEKHHQPTSSPRKESIAFDASFDHRQFQVSLLSYSHLQTQLGKIPHRSQGPVQECTVHEVGLCHFQYFNRQCFCIYEDFFLTLRLVNTNIELFFQPKILHINRLLQKIQQMKIFLTEIDAYFFRHPFCTPTSNGVRSLDLP